MSLPATCLNGHRNDPAIAIGLDPRPGNHRGIDIVESVRFWQIGQFIELGVLEGVEAFYDEAERSFFLSVRLRGVDREVEVYDSIGRLPRRWKSLDQLLKSLRSEGVQFGRIRIVAEIRRPDEEKEHDEASGRNKQKPVPVAAKEPSASVARARITRPRAVRRP
jgi:hypothetical protein